MKVSTVLFALLLMSGWAVAGSADVLILKTGQAVSGRFQGGDPTGVTFLVDGQYRRYDLTEVQSITIAPLPTTPAASAPRGAITRLLNISGSSREARKVWPV